jgi:hypothetical protein
LIMHPPPRTFLPDLLQLASQLILQGSAHTIHSFMHRNERLLPGLGEFQP